MIEVDSDDPIVADLLASTLELVADAGGWVHPQVRLVAREGQLSVNSAADDDAPLMAIPRAALVRVDAVTWAKDPSSLRVEELPDDVGDIELSLIYVQSALHNQVERLAWISRSHPAVTELPVDVVDAMRAFVPGFRATTTTPRDALFANRCLRVDLGDGRGVQRVLVPVLDLLNHHAGGAAPQWDGQTFTIATARAEGTAECFLDYGLERDALEFAAVYGFADRSATVAHLPRVTADVPGFGRVEVETAGRRESGDFAPLTVAERRDTISISHVTLSTDPDGMHRLVVDLSEAGGWDESTAAHVLSILGAEAREQSRSLAGMCRGDSAALAVLRAAADRQAEVLSTAVSMLSRVT